MVFRLKTVLGSSQLRHGVGLVVLFATGACHDAPTTPATPRETLVSVRPLATDESSTCALYGDGRLYCWGENSAYQQYGVAPTVVPTTPDPRVTSIKDMVVLSTGHGLHMCGITADHAGWCWGRATHGQIGSGDAVATGRAPSLIFGNMQWAELSVSRLTTCGLTMAGAAYCWGHNQRGEGGNSSRGLAEIATKPIAVETNLVFKTIAAGWLHACALTLDGTAYCWGDNNFGQLGLGLFDDTWRDTPQAVLGGIKFKQLSAGGKYTCGISTDHKAWCWGQNATGALGDGSTTNQAQPEAVASGLSFSSIAASTGFNEGANAPTPTVLQGASTFTCALTDAGTPYCWGWNGAGQLGDRTTINRLTPVAVAGNLTLTYLSLGGTHSCGMRNLVIWCWGGNAFGQLGNNSLTNSAIPVRIRPPFGPP